MMITNKTHREGIIDSEELFQELLGEYPSYEFKVNMVKEQALNTYATIDYSDIDQKELNTKINNLQQKGWRKIISQDDILRLCNGTQNIIAIGKTRNDDLNLKLRFSFAYGYKGRDECM